MLMDTGASISTISSSLVYAVDLVVSQCDEMIVLKTAGKETLLTDKVIKGCKIKLGMMEKEIDLLVLEIPREERAEVWGWTNI